MWQFQSQPQKAWIYSWKKAGSAKRPSTIYHKEKGRAWICNDRKAVNIRKWRPVLFSLHFWKVPVLLKSSLPYLEVCGRAFRSWTCKRYRAWLESSHWWKEYVTRYISIIWVSSSTEGYFEKSLISNSEATAMLHQQCTLLSLLEEPITLQAKQNNFFCKSFNRVHEGDFDGDHFYCSFTF